MLRNYLKITVRNLVKNKVYSFINIGGLAVGMAVAVLIGLWIYDEVTFDKYHQHYDRIAQLGVKGTLNGEPNVWPYLPIPLARELQQRYIGDFEHVVISTFTESHILAADQKKFMKTGAYMDAQAPQLLSLKMRSGSLAGLTEPYSVLLSESVAKAYFQNSNPIGQLMQIDNAQTVKVTGVYEDLPANSTFANVSFIAPWSLYEASNNWMVEEKNNWNGNSFLIYVQLADKADLPSTSAKIKNIFLNKIDEIQAKGKPELVLHPMKNWHLHQFFKNGVYAGGNVENVWLLGMIGVFVLLLACINFINLSTARSEKRAKEVGIRKAIGSMRSQLVGQFFSESLVVVTFALAGALVLTQLVLPFFNELSDKKMFIPWTEPLFWLTGIGFGLVTSLIAGSYPALYLSSFQPIKALKGAFTVGRVTVMPRKVLFVLQFSVSIAMMIGTMVVFQQIQHAKARPLGYERAGLLMIQPNSNDIHAHFDAVRDELLQSGAAVQIAESEMPATKVLGTAANFEWKGKDPNQSVRFPIPGVSYNYGTTVGWEFVAGRDFSKAFATDSAALILNESAVRFMGLKNPVGEIIHWDQKPFHVIGVIRDMIMESPYANARPSVFFLDANFGGIVNIRINPDVHVSESLRKIESVFRKYNPSVPFEYTFVDQEYAKKFGNEERIGKLTARFAVLAIFIACLGLFGLATFTAEAKVKEIGIRKILGASVGQIVTLLSKDFIILVVVAFVIAAPVAWYVMHQWLTNFTYRIDISGWIFALAGIAAIVITLLTISYQAIRAALANPVKSLRSE